MLSKVLDRIERDIVECKPQRAFVIGVNGVDTSGKTIFTTSLAEHFKERGRPVQMIGLDDFHHPRARREEGIDPIEAYTANAFDLKRLVAELLAPARRGEHIRRTLKLLNIVTDEYSVRKMFTIDKETIVLLEGVLLFRPPLDEFFDYRIFLDIPFEEVLRRAARRDVPLYGAEFLEKYRQKYIPVQQRYFRNHDPINKSDLIIDNTDFNRPEIRD